jgi:hypothetical protein
VTTASLLAATRGIELAADATPIRETDPVGGWRSVPVRLC